jgi:primosomal protein N''
MLALPQRRATMSDYERQMRYQERQREKGNVRVAVLVPKGDVERLKAYAERLRKAACPRRPVI